MRPEPVEGRAADRLGEGEGEKPSGRKGAERGGLERKVAGELERHGRHGDAEELGQRVGEGERHEPGQGPGRATDAGPAQPRAAAAARRCASTTRKWCRSGIAITPEALAAWISRLTVSTVRPK